MVLRPVFLSFDEVEAMRLVDLEGLKQEEAARVTGISRRTLWSDLKNGRRKVITALVTGRPLRILGGIHITKDEDVEFPSIDEDGSTHEEE